MHSKAGYTYSLTIAERSCGLGLRAQVSKQNNSKCLMLGQCAVDAATRCSVQCELGLGAIGLGKVRSVGPNDRGIREEHLDVEV